ncbi:ATP-binding protein [Peribacillus sp. B-H-3]|uniref:ATP-binding protein n=1 Tax=Peribacillus sp. B-H-3 TaxID=3400420 RepID=UPI003B0134A4
MCDQIEYLGRKIQEESNVLAAKTLNMPKGENAYSLYYSKSDYQYNLRTNLFSLLGSYLCTRDEVGKNNLVTCANLLGQRSVRSMASLDQSISIVHLSRTAIMDFLEGELNQGNISIHTLFKIIKIIDPICELISNTIINHYNENLSSTRFALDESNKDLKITLRELADLKNALNEATIFAITDRNDLITYVNDKFCEASGYTKEELIGQNHYLLNSQFHPCGFFTEIWDTIQRGEVWKGEILNKAKDGTTYWLDTTIVPFVDHNGETYQHISLQYDITEKKKTEETLQKTEKLSMVGELAAGIAHEIRNPLTTIKGFVQLLTESAKDPVFEDTILDEIDRINFIVSEFMVFAKPHTIYFQECNVTEILRSVIKFLQAEAHLKNVVLCHDFPEHDMMISGEKNQLKQVFLNIIKNAIESMPGGGKVRIAITENEFEKHIIIKDHGVGISEQEVKKLGEPFFTTKTGGNGLGLMVSYKIIQNHKGMISVHSELNKGTSFKISFQGNSRKKHEMPREESDLSSMNGQQ